MLGRTQPAQRDHNIRRFDVPVNRADLMLGSQPVDHLSVVAVLYDLC